MAASLSELLTFSISMVLVLNAIVVVVEGANSTWCVARSDASTQALQTALDYACGSGADCTPLQSDGLCFLPNTIQAHASYAFDSFYQRKGMSPGSCDFSGTANIAQTDPSYGSCMYPSSLSSSGGTTPTTATNNPNSPVMPTTTTTPTTTTPFYGNGGAGGLTPGMTPNIPDTDSSKASRAFMSPRNSMTISFLLVLSITTLKPMYVLYC